MDRIVVGRLEDVGAQIARPAPDGQCHFLVKSVLSASANLDRVDVLNLFLVHYRVRLREALVFEDKKRVRQQAVETRHRARQLVLEKQVGS